MNKITIIGNLTKEPEMRTTPSGVAVCTLTVAVNRRSANKDGNRETDFFRVTTWRATAEAAGRNLHKGNKVAVVGELTARTYKGNDGETRVSLDISADDLEYLTPRTESQAKPAYEWQTVQGELPWDM